jgi:hypothetical protein
VVALDLSELEADITKEEVRDAIKALPSDKALGPNGFMGAFYKSTWSIIKPEIMAAVQAFAHADNRSMSRLNNALIVLLPRRSGRLLQALHQADSAGGKAVKEILTIFGKASSLKTNMAKCSITPIYGGGGKKNWPRSSTS